MKRLLFLCSLLCLVTPAFGAGACPTGSNWVNLTTPVSGGAQNLTTASALGCTGAYYVSAAGSDSNAGTSEVVPFLHAPTMTNFTGSATLPAGTWIVFRGNDTWHFGNSALVPYVGAKSWTPTNNGTAGHPTYITVDPNWFSGSSFGRPIFSGDNPLPSTSSLASSCTYDFTAVNVLNMGASGHIHADGIEMANFCWSGNNTNAGFFSYDGTDAGVLRSYCHAMTEVTGTTSDEQACIHGRGNAYISDLTNQCLFNVFDNSDGSQGTNGTYPNGHATMEAIETSCAVIAYSVFNRVSNGAVSQSTQMHDLLMHDLYDPNLNQGGSNHGNLWNVDNDSLHNLGTQLLYNIIAYNNNTGVGFWLMPTTTSYTFNVVIWNFHNTGDCLRTGGSVITSNPLAPVTTDYMYNMVLDGTCKVDGVGASPGGDPAKSGPVHFANNQFGNYSLGAIPAPNANTTLTQCDPASGEPGPTICTWTDDGTNIWSVVGYSSSNNYAPTSGSGVTVGTGTNQTSLCSIFSSDNALCSGIASVGEVSGWGGQIASYPGVPIVARPSSGAWDTGPYEFSSVTQASAPSCTPGTGSYTSTQTVTCTNPNTGTTVMCYTTNGATPATNGAGTGCTTGTKYTTTISISTSSTLQIIAGTSTLTDSTVSSYTYTIDPQAATPSCTPGSGQYSAQQSVTCTDSSSGAIMCATKDQSTPATNGTTGCSNGTLYSGSITIPTALTLNVVAGGTGYTDSAVATYVYTGLLSYVTGFAADETENTSGSWTFSYAPTNANDAIPIYVQCHPSTGTITGVSLSASGWTITPLQTVNTGANDWGATFGAIAPNTSSATFTATFTGASNCSHFAIVMLDEFSGNNTAGGTTTFNATSSSAGTAGTCNQTAANLTPAVNNEAAWFACTDNASAATLPFSQGSTDNGGQMTEYQTLLGQTGVAQTPAYTSTSGTYLVMGVAIAPPSSGTVANPAFSLIAGSYLGSQLETLSDSTAGATICYTTDGSTPAAATAGTCSHGTTYTIPFLITQPSTTVKAIGTLGGSTNSSVVSASYTITNAAQLPTTQVDNNECLESAEAPAYELNLGTQTWVTGPPASCTFHVPYWTVGTPTFSGLQSAVNDLEACRTNFGFATALDIPPALYTASSVVGLVIPQSATSLASSCNVLRSTQDSSLPNGTTVCSHGVQDNLATSTDIGLDNPDCAGDALTYQLGTTVTSVPTGSITLANGTVTNSSAYNDVANMWTLQATGTNPAAMTTCSPLGSSSASFPPKCASTTLAPDHWYITDLEARMQAGNTGEQNIVDLAPTNSETATSQFATHIHFRKLWIHGDWSTLANGANQVTAGLNFTCVYCSLLDSQISEALRPGNEGHGIYTNYGYQLKINHNWVECCSIAMISGGFSGSGPPILGLIPHSDVEERRNRFTFPWSWLGVGTISGNSHGWNGSSIVRKNADELKVGQRILRAGNILEDVDNSGAQQGVMFDDKAENSSTGFGTNYLDTTTDLNEIYNIYRNGCMDMETVRSFNFAGLGGGSTAVLNRINIAYSLWYNQSPSNFGCTGINTGILLNSAGLEWQGTVTENAEGTGATFVANCSADEGGCIGQIASATVTGCTGAGTLTFSAPNLTGGFPASGTYNASCVATITVPGSGYTSVTVTSTTGTATATINATSTAPTTGAQVLNINPGDPVSIRQCSSVTAFNGATKSVNGKTVPSAIGPLATVGSATWTGTPTTGNLTVSYPWTATASASDSAGYCKLTNVQGGPENLSFTHNTVVSANVGADFITSGVNNVAQPPGGPNYALQNNLLNNILIGGTFGNSVVTGGANGMIGFDFDTSSLTLSHNALPGQSSFTAFGNNPFSPISSPATFVPANSYCTGASPTSACIGFAGSEYYSASSLVIAPADYHDLALNAASSFAAGNADQASDGTNLGANIASLDTYQTLNQYPGFFPDTLPSFSCTPTLVPADHSNPIALTCTGAFTVWTSGTVFTGGGCTVTSYVNNSATSETVNITTTAAGTCTITETTDSITASITVGTAGLTISPTTGATSTTPTLTLTCTGSPAPCLWSSESLSGLFTVAGGSGASLTSCSVSSNTAGSCTLGTGTLPGTLTVEDQSTTATAPFTVTGSPTTQQFHIGCPVGTSCPVGHFKISGGVIQ